MPHLKISVVTVSYNAVATIEETILSVVDQTCDNIEYIVIDGGSTDGTVDIIKRYAEGGSEYGKHNNSISYWVSEPDKGIYDAMNKGIAAATGDYINFMNAGDCFFNNDIIAKSLSVIKKNNEVYYGDVLEIKKGKIIGRYGGYFSTYKFAIENTCHQSMFLPVNILKKRPYRIEYRILADYEMNLYLHKITKFNYINEVIANYDVTGISKTSKDDIFKKNKARLIYSNLGFLPYIYSFFYSSYKTIRRSLYHSILCD